MKKIFFMAVAIAALSFTSCDKNSNTDFDIPSYEEKFAEAHLKVNEVTADGYTVQLFADEELFVGYNRLYFLVKENATGELIKDFSVKVTPMMDMGMMMHTSPNEVPSNPDNDMMVIQQNMVFIMPSTAGTWNLEGELTLNEGDTPIAFDIPVSVVEKTDSRMLTFMSDADSVTKLFLILDEPLIPVVGENEIVFGIYKRESMMSFPAVEDYSIEFEPEMPTMGHGSPNNVNPTYMDNGLYKGVVNFTMTGYWRINVVLKDASGNVVKEGISFDVNF